MFVEEAGCVFCDVGTEVLRFVEMNSFRGLISVCKFTVLYTDYFFFPLLFAPVTTLYTPMSNVNVKGSVSCCRISPCLMWSGERPRTDSFPQNTQTHKKSCFIKPSLQTALSEVI